MSKCIRKKIKVLERKLKDEYNATAHFPDGVPVELQLQLLERAYLEVPRDFQDQEFLEMRELFGEMHINLDFCSGYCPGCEILQWCATAKEMYSEEEVSWMKEHGDYPPEPEKDPGSSTGSGTVN